MYMFDGLYVLTLYTANGNIGDFYISLWRGIWILYCGGVMLDKRQNSHFLTLTLVMSSLYSYGYIPEPCDVYIQSLPLKIIDRTIAMFVMMA